MNGLKQRLKSGEAVHGCWLNMGTSVSAEIVGRAGFDWVLIDLEHGANTESEAFVQLRVLRGCPCTPLVRVESHIRQRTQRILDMGAMGIMYPQINTAEEAEKAVSSMYYPPKGSRGAAFMIPATGYGDNFDAYREGLSENLLGIIQIETPKAIDEIDHIAALEYVDVLFIGPLDLSLSLGTYGKQDHPDFVEALNRTVGAANKYGKTAGIILKSPEQYKQYYEWGFRMIACGADSIFVKNGAQQMVETLGRLRSEKTG